MCDVNVVINVQGLLHGLDVQFLLDSGAAQSVVGYDTLDEVQHGQLTSIETLGANGLLLPPPGTYRATFHAIHPFIVVQDLTIDCLLGAHFFTEHRAVIDCQCASLSLGSEARAQIPLTQG